MYNFNTIFVSIYELNVILYPSNYLINTLQRLISIYCSHNMSWFIIIHLNFLCHFRLKYPKLLVRNIFLRWLWKLIFHLKNDWNEHNSSWCLNIQLMQYLEFTSIMKIKANRLAIFVVIIGCSTGKHILSLLLLIWKNIPVAMKSFWEKRNLCS